MSKKAAEHHRHASEHHAHAARHHGEAAKHHETDTTKRRHTMPTCRGPTACTRLSTLNTRPRHMLRNTGKNRLRRAERGQDACPRFGCAQAPGIPLAFDSTQRIAQSTSACIQGKNGLVDSLRGG